MKKKILLCIGLVIAILLLKAVLPNEVESDMRVAQKGYVKINGFQYLEDIYEPSILESIPEHYERVGYTSKLNPDADYYASNEMSGAEVYQDPDRVESVYVKRENGFVRYTLLIAHASFFIWEGEFYIRDDFFLDDYLSEYNTKSVRARKPSKNKFLDSGKSLFLGGYHQIPRSELETNDYRLDGASVWYIPSEKNYLCVELDGEHIYYVRIEKEEIEFFLKK